MACPAEKTECNLVLITAKWSAPVALGLSVSQWGHGLTQSPKYATDT